MSRAGREESMFIKHSSRMGWNLIGFPFGKFLVPIIRLRDQLLIPDDPGVSLVEILKTDDRVRARRLCRALCRAGVPVFNQRGGGMLIYCPGLGGRLVFEAFDFSSPPPPRSDSATTRSSATTLRSPSSAGRWSTASTTTPSSSSRE